MADQFCLRWNHFQTNIVSALDSLKRSEDLVDVTLTCEGRSIKAHKVILSACSPYFRNVFKENPCQHPVIILKDVSADDIVSLLSYMYQGEVFIDESKLPSFLHTAALLQVKGLTGVTQQKEIFSSPNSSNKLYTQLTISPKSHLGFHKENKIPALKKRRSSTSDKPNDVNVTETKKSKCLDTNEIQKSNLLLPKLDNIAQADNHVEKRNEISYDSILTINGKSSHLGQTNTQSEHLHMNIKVERPDDVSSPISQGNGHSENDDSLPDYENSMLARSLLSGINPSKSDICANSVPAKKVSNAAEVHGPATRTKDVNEITLASVSKSPHKTVNNNDTESTVKSERHSPKSDVDYEPEVLLSEQNDSTDGDHYTSEQSQALMLLAGMSTVPIGSGASTSQGVSHPSNHAAICGDCPHCGMKYSNQSALKYHVRLMHSDLTNRLCCYLCPRSFTMRETFKEHMWASHGQRN